MFVRTSVALAAVTLMASGDAAASGGWKHVGIHRHKGRIQATLSYETRTVDEYLPPEYRRMRLVVRRAGTVVIDWLFQAGHESQVALTLRNVWGDSEPEALVEIQTGANTCCVQLGVGLTDGDQGGRVLFHDFGNYPGWQGQWHDRRFDFVSRDSRFYCAFTDCASSSTPIQIFAIDKAGRGFVNVTRSRPDLVAADAAGLWKGYLRERGKRTYPDPVGVLAPWCADQYVLAQKKHCDHALAQALARGYLDGWHGSVKGGRGVISLLHKTLVVWGCDRS